MKAKTFKAIVFSCAAVLVALLIVLSVVVSMFSDLLDKFVVGYKDGATSGAARAAGKELAEQIEGEGAVLVKNVQEDKDGVVAQENGKDKPLLPMLKQDTKPVTNKVNVFGWASTDWVISGSGSGQVKRANATLLLGDNGALKTAGIDYNTDLEKMYENFKSHRYMSINGSHASKDPIKGNDMENRGSGSLHSFNYEFSRLYEPNINDENYYTDTLLENAKNYSDTAIVVIGRVSGESNDSPKEQYRNAPDGKGKPADRYIDKTRTYLEISEEEEALLTYVGENYENVIVLINSTNVMELGFMETIKGLDACLVVATTGSVGTYAIPRLLYSNLGKVEIGKDDDGQPIMKDFSAITPSGKLADTYAYDLSTSSTYVDTGSGNDSTHFYSNTLNNTNSTVRNGLYPTNVWHTNGSADEAYKGVAYQDYREGVYMGYKWYETADEMDFWTSDFAKEHWTSPKGGELTGYKDVVQYPFGFGLSYTTFSWNIISVELDGSPLSNGSTLSNLDKGTIKIRVEVTNTGSVAGQDVVELYYSAPYTKGGIEKSSVNLVAFGKTQVLQPGGDPGYVILEFDISDMASYDYSEKKIAGGGYIMEEGDYALTLRTDSHTVADSKMVVTDKSFLDKETATLTYKVSKDTQVKEESSNLFTGEEAIDGVAIDGNSDGSVGEGNEIVYLSREKFDETFPIELGANRAMTDEVKALNLYTKAMATAWDEDNEPGDVELGIDSERHLVYENGEINALGKRLGTNYNDPEWEIVLDCITKDEMTYLVLHGYAATRKIDSIGKPETLDLDGPNQIGSFVDSFPEATGYSSIVLAQSWNLELAYSMGLAFGNECISYGVQGWYGPGVNVHRSPFGGRNYEYYSEDAYMSGMLCAKVVEAAKNKGVFCYLKHLCLYEGESGRDGMYTWVTEQAFREIYAKPFELAVKVGGSNAIMTSYGRVGAVWTGGSYALLTNLVRGEWGFQGAFLTDYADHHDFMNGDQMVRAGGDLWMDWYSLTDSGTGKFTCDTNSNTFKQALRNATKNVVYMWLNSLATNAEYNEKIAITGGDTIATPGAPVLNFRWYIPVVVVVDVLLAAGAGVLVFFGIKKKDKVVADGEPETTESAEPVNETAEEPKAEPVAQAVEPTENKAESVEEVKAEPETAETPAPAKKPAAKPKTATKSTSAKTSSTKKTPPSEK